MHTNYVAYAQQNRRGPAAVGGLWALNQLMCAAYCHKTVKLSAALQRFAAAPKECVSNVHGVRSAFHSVGATAAVAGFPGSTTREAVAHAPRTAQCYFLSKHLWAKGYRSLFKLIDHHRRTMGGRGVALDLYGSGPDSAAIGALAAKTGLDVAVKGFSDHADLARCACSAKKKCNRQ